MLGSSMFTATSLTPETRLGVIVVPSAVNNAIRAMQLTLVQIFDIKVISVTIDRQIYEGAMVGGPAATHRLRGLHQLCLLSSLLSLEVATHLLGLPDHL